MPCVFIGAYAAQVGDVCSSLGLPWVAGTVQNMMLFILRGVTVIFCPELLAFGVHTSLNLLSCWYLKSRTHSVSHLRREVR